MSAAAGTVSIVKGTLVSTLQYTWNTADSLGRGASAVVYLGRHNTKGTLVAVKVFHDHVNMGFREDDRELLMLKKLNHPNIIKMLDIEKLASTNKCVLVLEYCEGASLHHMLDTPPHFYGLQESEFLRVLTHVSAGIQYLRQGNVIHRDIKPGNIMRYITEEGFSIYKLTDFGAARNLDDSESFQSLYGTEEYLHPAIYEKAVLRLPTTQSFDAKVDLWSLGVTFYHTATGQLPFQAFGGRSNRTKMFDIISQKESGVISGVQKLENGPIEWKSDLPETSPLTSGLKSVIIPLLAGLMEPNEGKMLTYDSMFRIIQNIEKKVTVTVFHYSRCEELVIYVEPSTTFTGLKDDIASLTDIPSVNQILLIGGQLLERVLDPLAPVSSYPDSIKSSGIFLFQREVVETQRLSRPDLPSQPVFPPYANIDEDARLAHNCAAQGELIKRYTERASHNQLLLMNGLTCLRVYVESRLSETQNLQDFMLQLMEEGKHHHETFFNVVQTLRDVRARQAGGSSIEAVKKLDFVLQNSAITDVHRKARERITEIQQYRDMLKRKIDEIKTYASKLSVICEKEKCLKKVKHHLSQISGIQSRFRRDRNVKHQMTAHDQHIHTFERNRLKVQCDKMRGILVDHCLPHLEGIFKHGLHVSESLTKCLMRVHKIEKNIHSVITCQKLLTDKLLKQRNMCTSELRSLDSAYMSDMAHDQSSRVEMPTWNAEEATGGITSQSYTTADIPPHLTEGLNSLSGDAKQLQEKLQEIHKMLATNTELMKNLDETTLQSSGSLTKHMEEMQLEKSDT